MSAMEFWVCWGAMAVAVVGYGWVWKRAGVGGRKWLEWGLAAWVAGVSAASVALHEPWADELHTWLQARELTVGELWREMAYEGHFLPWHLILHPFARLGAPVETMGWVSWAINAVTVAWFVRKAPLGGWAKAAVGLSCVFLYVNPVISRCYVLVPLALFGVASLWGRRDERPFAFGLWVALLANTHIYMEGTAAVLFGVYAWENVLRRKDGRRWRECGWQWAGLGVMAAGGALALAQVLPSLWKSSVETTHSAGWAVSCFAMGCPSWVGVAAMLAGLVGLGVLCLRSRGGRGIFWVYAGSLAFMVCFSVFLYPANIVNRAMLWWPLAIAAAWALAEGSGGTGRWAGLAVAVMGVGVMRPDMTVADWRWEYDSLRGACRAIAERYGNDVEVWVDGSDFVTEAAVLYLGNVMDWQTGRRAERICLKAGRQRPQRPFQECMKEIFAARSEEDRLLSILVPVHQRLSLESLPPEMEIVHRPEHTMSPLWTPVCAFEIWRGSREACGRRWMQTGMERLARGERVRATTAWERAVEVDAGAWEAMNNLAWLALEEGRVAEARAWIDRAMEHEAARESVGARDTEAAVGEAEERCGGKLRCLPQSGTRSDSPLGEGAKEEET